LQEDPHELKNLSNKPEYAGVRKQLAAELLAWRRRVEPGGVTSLAE
jgi:hypothetical protein